MTSLVEDTLQYKSPPLTGIKALSCSSDFVFDNHIHSGHVLWLNSKGGENFKVLGTTSVLQPGSISIIEPGIVHSNQPLTKSKRHLRSLYLENDFFLHLEKLVTGTSTQKYNLPTTVINNIAHWRDALALHEAIITGQNKLLIEELCLSLFTPIGDLHFGSSSVHHSIDKGDSRISIIIDYMRAHLENEISLNTLAEIAGCTSYHIIRLFKEIVGMSPHAYLIQLRLERARNLIDKGKTISDAALDAGFSDQSHLTRNFKKRFGITPGIYGTQKLL